MKPKLHIIHDPGHGGHDPGALGKTESSRVLQEKEFTLAMSRTVRARLRGLYGYGQVTQSFTRDEDKFVSLSDRVKFANELQAKQKIADRFLFISYHYNSSSNREANGMEVFTAPGETLSDKLATALYKHGELFKVAAKYRTDHEDGDPDKEAHFYVLKHTKMPAILIEHEFITSSRLIQAFIEKQEHRDRWANAIAAAIQEIYGLGSESDTEPYLKTPPASHSGAPETDPANRLVIEAWEAIETAQESLDKAMVAFDKWRAS